MASVFYIVKTLISIAIYIVILRLWMQYARVDFYNPFTQFIIKITQPIIGRMRKIIPSFGKIDTSTVLMIYILAVLKVIFIASYALKYPIWSNYYLFYGLFTALHSAGTLLFWLLLIRAILSWISRGQSTTEDLLYQLTEPLVRPIRRIVPPLGSIDISFMIVVFVLLALNLLATEIFASSIFGIIWMLL